MVAPTSPLVLRVLNFNGDIPGGFCQISRGVVVVSSKAINYLHLHRMAVGMSGADNN